MEFRRNEEKNRRLWKNRGIGFEEIVDAISDGGLVAEELHDNQKKYPGQYIYFVLIDGYVYRVPFIREENGDVFLKTLMKSRVATKRFIS